MVALVDRITAIEHKFDTPDDLLSRGSMHHGSAPPVNLPITASESRQTIGNMNFSDFISEFKLREGKKCNVIVSGLCASADKSDHDLVVDLITEIGLSESPSKVK